MGEMATYAALRQLAELVEREPRELFVRWSRGPGVDLPREQSSRDDLTGSPMPGLSANSLAVEPWWGGRPLELWLARRLYDYHHLPDLRGPGVRPWVLTGDVVGRGPDNEPLVVCREALGWIADPVLAEAARLVTAQGVRTWGPLDRRTVPGPG
ncbi:hypothetical protein GCM10009679_78170 [Saccharothrix algeriensis]|uniref:Uncharacterized protein n=2 Tax=Catellatospora bangladeshensis TaxID=310355 RepID=A0A8J3NPP3_9ACTN|nr:hypothetical protein Cba03nite_75140 [Catellatospora bangladeshensis]